jgi:voltage-gated potassium channel
MDSLTVALRARRPGDPRRGRDVTVRTQLSIAETLRPFAARFAAAAAYFAVVTMFATVGYRAIEEWSWFDSFYMSVTTVSAVGFMEVHPLSAAGRGFTAMVIALGVTGLGIWWALTTAVIVELDLGGALRRRRRMKQIEGLEGHYVVCGAGRVGRMVVQELERMDQRVVVIERDPARAYQIEEALPHLPVLSADATKERVLTVARVQFARGVAACLDDDADNLLVCLSARHLNPKVATVARAYDEESMDKLLRAGADHVISPTLTAGARMASTLLRPNVVSFLDATIVGRDMDLRLEEAVIPEGSPLHGASLGEARIPQETGLIVIAVQRARGDGDHIYNPGPDTRLAAGDVMIVLGRGTQLKRLEEYVRAE